MDDLNSTEYNIENLELFIKNSGINFCKNCNQIYSIFDDIYKDYCNNCWVRCIICNKIIPMFSIKKYKGIQTKCTICLKIY